MVKIGENRNTGIDLLKILLAMMVISIHFCAPATGAVAKSCDVMPMKLFISALMGLVYPAVNCYVLITSYFLYNKKKTMNSVFCNLFKIWMALLTFSLLGYITTCILNYQSFSVMELAKRFFPIIRGEWWFMSVYFALMISVPFLLRFIDSISTGTHRMIVIISFVTCTCFPFFTKYEENLGLDYGYSYLWFVVLFFLGTYLRRIEIVNRCNLLICFIGFIVCGVVNQAFGLFVSRVTFLQGYTTAMYNSFLVCIQSVFLFLTFARIQSEKQGRTMNCIVKLASLSMASYIFHCQEDIGGFFWETTHPSTYANTYSLFIIYILIVIGLYLISITLELIRRKLMSIGDFENRIVTGVARFAKRAYSKIDAVVVRKIEQNTK